MPKNDYEIVRNDASKCIEFESAGYSLVSTSWGAQLNTENDFDVEVLKQRIMKSRNAGYRLEILGAGHGLLEHSKVRNLLECAPRAREQIELK